MNIMFVTLEFSASGGAGIYALEVVNQLSRGGVTVHVMTSDINCNTKSTPNILIHKLRVINLPLVKIPLHHLQVWLKAGRIIKQNGISLVYSNNYAGAYVRSKVPFYATIHHPAKEEVKHSPTMQKIIYYPDIFFEQRVLKRARTIVVDSHLVRNMLRKLSPSSSFALMPCGINLESFSNNYSPNIRNSLGIDESELIIFFPGGARSKRKGALDLLNALSIIKDFKFRCVVSGKIGDRDLGWRRELESALEKTKLQDRFIFVGELKCDELPGYYLAADIVVYPSTLEGFGLPALEALACGRPFIGTRTGEMPYIIKDKENGLLVDVNNPEQLAESLNTMMTSEDFRNKISIKARASIKKYSWETLAESLIVLFKDPESSIYENIAE